MLTAAHLKPTVLVLAAQNPCPDHSDGQLGLRSYNPMPHIPNKGFTCPNALIGDVIPMAAEREIQCAKKTVGIG